jgi:hypothetical protein
VYADHFCECIKNVTANGTNFCVVRCHFLVSINCVGFTGDIISLIKIKRIPIYFASVVLC